MGFWTYGDADKHRCNDRCWCNGDAKPKRESKTVQDSKADKGKRKR